MIQAVGCDVPNAKQGLRVMGARRRRMDGPGVTVDTQCAGSILRRIRLRAGVKNVPETPASIRYRANVAEAIWPIFVGMAAGKGDAFPPPGALCEMVLSGQGPAAVVL